METINQSKVRNSIMAWDVIKFEFAKKWWNDKNCYGYGSFNEDLYRKIVKAKFSKIVKE